MDERPPEDGGLCPNFGRLFRALCRQPTVARDAAPSGRWRTHWRHRTALQWRCRDRGNRRMFRSDGEPPQAKPKPGVVSSRPIGSLDRIAP